MSTNTVIFLGAGYLQNYEFDKLQFENFKFILICGEYSYKNLKEKDKKFFQSIKVVSVLPFEDKSVEIFDPQSVRDTLKNILLIHPKSIIYCDDEKHLLLAAKLREDFNLEGHKIKDIILFRDKTAMKDSVAKCGVEIPKYAKFDVEKLKKDSSNYFSELVSSFNLPFVIKPIDLSGSYGVSIIRGWKDFTYLRQDIDTRVHYEVEEFVQGTLFNYDAIIDANGQALFEDVCECICPCADFLDGKTYGAFLMPDNDSMKNAILKFAAKVTTGLNAFNCVVHLEFFKTSDNRLIFLEIAMRPGGFVAPIIYNEVYNISLFTYNILANIGKLANSIAKIRNYDYYFVGYFPTKAGVVDRLTPPNLSSKFDIVYYIKAGQEINNPISLGSKAGYFKIADSQFKQFMANIKLIKTCSFYEIKA